MEDTWSKALLKQSHSDPVAQDHVQTAFGDLQEWRLHSLHGLPVSLLGHPHIEKVFLDVATEPLQEE